MAKQKLKYGSAEFTQNLNATASRIGGRVKASGTPVGIDPVTIITIITTVLPLLFKLPCFNQPTPAETAAALRKATSTPAGAARVERQVAAKIKRTAKRRNHATISNEDAAVLARASIVEALATDGQTLATYAVACVGVIDDE